MAHSSARASSRAMTPTHPPRIARQAVLADVVRKEDAGNAA